MAADPNERKVGGAVPRSLLAANLLAVLIALSTLAFGLPAYLRIQAQEAKALAQRRKWQQQLVDAVGTGSAPKLRQMLQGRGPLGHDGDEALCSAANAGFTEGVTILLQHGALPNAALEQHGYNSVSPLDNAIMSGNTKTLLTLLKAGARTDFVDKFGQTSMHMAAQSGNLDAIRILRRRGVDLNTLDEWRNTPRDTAERSSQERAARYLRSLGAQTALELQAASQ